MTTLLSNSSDTRTASIMPRALHALTALHAIVATDRPVRAAIVGGSGSGKTDALRFLLAQLEADDRPVRLLSARDRISTIPDDVALLVDDAHTLDPARLSQLIDRAHRPDASVVIAYRSWPAPSELLELTRAVERNAPAVLLGEITLAELREILPDASAECEERILSGTGGIAWLVFECAQAHAALSYEGRDCGDPEAHADATRVLMRRITHRLETVSPRLRRRIEALSLGVSDGDDRDAQAELSAEGQAEGLLLHNGRPAPVVAMAARASVPVDRLVDLVQAGTLDLVPGSDLAASLDGIVDPGVGDRLAARARREVGRNPHLAVTLFDYALRCGSDPRGLAAAHAHALWAAGDVDAAGSLLDDLAAEGGWAGLSPSDHDLLTDAVAATWADRGLMSLAHQSYLAVTPLSPAGKTRALVTAAGAGSTAHDGDPAPDAPGAAGSAPSANGVAMQLWARGLRASLQASHSRSALDDLRRASELANAGHDASPTTELPAVVAAIVAIGLGDLGAAHGILDDAQRAQQGGARWIPHLQLWNAWVALQREQPAEARALLTAATDGTRLSPRDDLIAAAIAVGLARRYDDAPTLEAMWESVKSRATRPEIDLYLLLPLGELVIVAARLGDAHWTQAAFDRGLALLADLGEPSLWSAPLHWAGIQRGIMLSRPDDLAPHARALVASSSRNPLAAKMSHAGRVWTSVLAGQVDADAVEEAARGLASVGLAWDGARLAGHGSRRSDDRKVSSRLLACARELHPREAPRSADADSQATPARASAPSLLSEREREVAELVLQGKTYAEIGKEIFISPRTAEHHMAQIKRRLGASSRSDLIAKLRVTLGATG
ncbi:LuxR C-terminal-related transcriptional regulator [Microbacterium invictum]|uniref:LuxR C-terminal-related transcriptional regulator n=1 Tax=Microbacterium invictum TaxID=515415 RepID=A0ABZ0V8C2_9MICO|nr:LuxR C-terminal-related transcriptional regulator [Microbacterium invictum]WQB69719.1 LuxR C-terminal-related transcriptional regulator [Microbacterium invictum]